MEKKTLEGDISDIIYYNDDTGYVIAHLETLEDSHCIKGVIPFLKEGDRLKVIGKTVVHDFYGEQIEVQEVKHLKPSTVEDIYRYLASGVISGVGESTAKLLVEAFGEKTLDIIEHEPEKMMVISGIGEKKCAQIKASYDEQYAMRDEMIYFQKLGLTVNMAMRIYKKYGEDSLKRVQENPYLLAEEISGVGFQVADDIARRIGIEKKSPFRIQSAILHVLSQASMQGHVYMEKEELLTQVRKILQIDEELIPHELTQMAVAGSVQLSGKPVNVYLPSFYYAEQQVAAKLYQLTTSVEQMPSVDMDQFISEYESEKGIKFADLQKKALSEALEAGVFILTGGPGTGKTTLINALITLYESFNKKVVLCAPTGRAAKRMSEATMREAKTIHRLLEFTGENQYLKNASDPISCDVLIVDEISMVDIVLMYRLLDAVSEGRHVILVGDADQLPSVGPGAVLKDILKSLVIPHVALNTIFRQSETSLIASNAHLVNQGLSPLLNVKEKDFFFIKRQQAQDIVKEIEKLVTERLPSYYGYDPKEDIQILTPMKNTDVGVIALNEKLQEVINPHSHRKAEKKFGQKILRQGDKVMQIKNNYQLNWTSKYGDEGQGVFNGDIGYITFICEREKIIYVDMDGDRAVEYPFHLAEELMLAYAITVHKSQGSEFKAVIMPMVYGPPMLMNRNILYTAMTRAKELVVLVGHQGAMESMIANDKEQTRRTGLRERLVFFQSIHEGDLNHD